MPWMKWLPWRFVVRHVARSHGFIDPIALLARLHRFTQPSEVGEPVELLRAGVVFHARGLINSRVIQHNLDWIWPYWIERQFDPRSDAFIPRAFSITHVNLTHRNWTAIGWPDESELPIVDPRGLLTPFFDGWSLDAWVVAEDGRRLFPSRVPSATQRLETEGVPTVITETAQDGLLLRNRATVQLESGRPVCRLELQARSDACASMVGALCPFNPEGISFIHSVALSPERNAWTIDGLRSVEFSAPAEHHHTSDYRTGAVSLRLHDRKDQIRGECDVGMATAAAHFELDAQRLREIVVRIPLADARRTRQPSSASWGNALAGHCKLALPNVQLQLLYEAALRALVLHSPDEAYPGPYTYKRFWFRDAAFIIHGLLCAGLTQRAERALDHFPGRQTRRGYFHSQAGEWDSNGEALWIMNRFCELSGRSPKPRWRQAIMRGARWIARKRLAESVDAPHAGLLPAGFSAEHLGPNDYYYWDDFWGIAGLEAAASMCAKLGDNASGAEFQREADAFRLAVDRSLAQAAERLDRPAMPATPYRRLDAGAIGSLAVGYPLRMCAPDDPRLLDTVAFLLEDCFVDGGFFQDMIHSGINPYLTLHVAQVLLRAGDNRCLELMDSVASLASSTGQWPEAIHPRTRGGCMGDGQHIWAAAEWVLMLRNCLLREEGDRLIVGSGIAPHWLQDDALISFGPAPSAFGTVALEIAAKAGAAGRRACVSWSGDWHAQAPAVEVRLPGLKPIMTAPGESSIELSLPEFT
jgi:hypothetical protein